MQRPPAIATWLFLLLAPITALAGRPLSTDDAGVSASGECQIEGWMEKARSQRAQVLSGGCGLGADVDFGIDLTRLRPKSDTVAEVGGNLKWSPSSLSIDLAGTTITSGASIGFTTSHPIAAGWLLTGFGARAVLSIENGPFAAHFNLGPQRDRQSSSTTTVLNTALTYSPIAAAMVFAEWQTNDRRDAVGATLRTFGGRCWLVQDRWALDLTRSSTAGGAAPSSWSLGFGWYGIGL